MAARQSGLFFSPAEGRRATTPLGRAVGTVFLFSPGAQQLAQEHELAEVVGVMVHDQQGLAQ